MWEGTEGAVTATSPLHPKAASSYSVDVQWRQKKGQSSAGVWKCKSQTQGVHVAPIAGQCFALYHWEFGAFASIPICPLGPAGNGKCKQAVGVEGSRTNYYLLYYIVCYIILHIVCNIYYNIYIILHNYIIITYILL